MTPTGSLEAPFLSTSPAQTRRAGIAIGQWLISGDVVALCGPLGAGKTELVKGIAAGLNVPADQPVVSPTFVLVREYVGRLTLFHLDAYRLSEGADLLELGFDEICGLPDSAVAVEWADRVAGVLPHDATFVELDHRETNRRCISVAPPLDHPAAAELLAELARVLSPARRGNGG